MSSKSGKRKGRGTRTGSRPPQSEPTSPRSDPEPPRRVYFSIAPLKVNGPYDPPPIYQPRPPKE